MQCCRNSYLKQYVARPHKIVSTSSSKIPFTSFHEKCQGKQLYFSNIEVKYFF